MRRLVVLMVLLCMALAVSAAATVQITETEVILDIDYIAFTEEDQKIINKSTAFTITNPDAANATVSITIPDLAANYILTPITDVVVPGNGSASVSFELAVPHKQDAGKIKIGTITVNDGTTRVTTPLIQETADMLIIDKIEVDYTDKDGKARSDSFNTDESDDFSLDKNLRPGTEVVILVKVENRFNDKDYDEGEIDNIELKVDADDDAIFPNDYDEDYSISDLKPDEKETVEIKFVMPDDVDEGGYTLEFTLEGRDGKNAEYTLFKQVSLDIDRIKDDVRVSSSKITPSPVCGTTFNLDLEITNYGTDDQEFAAISIFNTQLGINENVQDIVINEFDDSDNTWGQLFSFAIPEVSPGTYQLDVRTYVDRDEEIDFELVNVVISDCTPSVNDEESDTNNSDDEESDIEVITNTFTNDGVEAGTVSPAAATVNADGEIIRTIEGNNDNLLFAVLVVGVVLLVAMIILFMLILLKK